MLKIRCAATEILQRDVWAQLPLRYDAGTLPKQFILRRK
jgi:hypothetical protein